MKHSRYIYSTITALLVITSASAQSDSHQSSPAQAGHMQHMQMSDQQSSTSAADEASTVSDGRQWVEFPEKIKEHELWSMRDHLLTIHKIENFLANEQYEKAADLAETRLGFSSFKLHGAHESGKYMPEGMRAAGTAMHHSASQFARAAAEASVTGGLKKAVSALATLTSKCIACHAAYRLR